MKDVMNREVVVRNLRIILAGLFGLMVLLVTWITATGGYERLSGDYDVYCVAAEAFPDAATMYDRDVVKVNPLYYRYSPPFAWFMKGIGCRLMVGWLVAGLLAYLSGLALMYRSQLFEPMRRWVIAGIANSQILAVLGFMSVSLILFPLGVIAALLVSSGASVWLIALAVLPALLTKPHWAVFFLGAIWLKPLRYILKAAIAIVVVYVLAVAITRLLMPQGWELWQAYWSFLGFVTEGQGGLFQELPTYEQGLLSWGIYLFGDQLAVRILHRVIWIGILANYIIQVVRIRRDSGEDRALRLIGLTYVSGALLLPDMQDLVLAFIPMAVVAQAPIRSFVERVFRMVLWVVFIIWSSYAFTGLVGLVLQVSPGSLWERLTLFQIYTPITLILAILLLIGVSWVAIRHPARIEHESPVFEPNEISVTGK